MPILRFQLLERPLPQLVKCSKREISLHSELI
jgi:hypothetical protein